MDEYVLIKRCATERGAVEPGYAHLMAAFIDVLALVADGVHPVRLRGRKPQLPTSV